VDLPARFPLSATVLHNNSDYATQLPIGYSDAMASTADTPALFGDLLALARQSWVVEMTRRLENLGFHDYRRSDAASLRRLRRGGASLGELALMLSVTRQAGRKVVDGLVARGYALVERDGEDARRLIVALTAAGSQYAQAILDTVMALDQELDASLDPYDLVVVKSVLRSVSSIYGND
jgi:DNA-binding MarR family transcriptional regulator